MISFSAMLEMPLSQQASKRIKDCCYLHLTWLWPSLKNLLDFDSDSNKHMLTHLTEEIGDISHSKISTKYEFISKLYDKRRLNDEGLMIKLSMQLTDDVAPKMLRRNCDDLFNAVDRLRIGKVRFAYHPLLILKPAHRTYSEIGYI